MTQASRLLRAAGVVAALVVAPGVPGADESAPVPRPDVKVGDRWRYEQMEYVTNVPKRILLDVRVSFVAPDSIVTIETLDEGREFDSQFDRQWSANSLGSLGLVFNPPQQFFSFPLQPGKTFPVAFELVAQRSSPARSRFEGSGKVIGWEEVVVPAGRFRALKVQTNVSVQRLDANLRGWNQMTIWYAPDAKRWVKFVFEASNQSPNSLGLVRTLELLEFKVQ